jgi:CSLREA domain-containing protein
MFRKRTRRNQKRFITALALAGSLLIAGLSLSHHLRNWIQPTAHAATFTVTNAEDHTGDPCTPAECTLREAIEAVNAGSGGDTISFNIPGAGVHTINLTSALPTLNKTVTIDGTSQPGFSGSPLIELNGTNAGPADGLTICVGNSAVKGLVINRFNGDGILIRTNCGTVTGGNVISGNYIGTNAAGTAAAANAAFGVEISNVSNNTIGGTTVATRNVISGNGSNGIRIAGTASGNLIQGNFVGTNATGTAGVANGTNSPGSIDAVEVSGSNNTIGGTATGAGNVISGNANNGLSIFGTANIAQGNFVGTDPTGNAALGNFRDGIIVGGTNAVIGGTSAAARNVVAGNTGGIGIDVCCSGGATGNQVQGNYVGVKADGSALGNGQGVRIASGNANNVIGGTVAGAGNVISGNNSVGISIVESGTTGNQVQGNFIGVNPAGTSAMSNGSYGVYIDRATSNTIGGTTAAARNVISGHSVANVAILTAGTTGNQIIGNFIGTQADGVSQLAGNTGAGVYIYSAAANNFIGNTTAGSGNVIAFNDQGGIRIDGNAGNGNAILGNSIFSNGALGIDLKLDGVTPNDNCDADAGPNNLQNFPVLTSAAAGAVNTTISGTLNSTASTTFRIEFFSNTVCDPSGNGEGQVFLGSTSVTTNGSCTADINFVVPNASISGQYITATATDSNNNTSEFSACVQRTTTNAVIQFSAPNYNVGEGDGSVTITVNRSVDTSAFSSIDFATGNNEYRPCTPGDPQNLAGVATQNCDFIRNQGTLIFSPGDTSKTFTVLIVDDGNVDGTETFPVTLSNLVGGPPAVIPPATVTIADNDTAQATSPVPFRFSGAFTGAQETPPNNSNGSGAGVVLLTSNDLTKGQAGLQFSNLGSSETGAHIHGPGSPGVPAPIIFPLPTTNPVINFQLNGITAQQVSDMRSGLDYLNVHSQNFQNGEIRAQLLWNPTLEQDFFVRQHYLDFLQREPDPGGFTFWTGQISPCLANVQCLHDKTIVVSNAFFYELEYQQTGAYAYRLFREAFGNTQPQPNPDASNPTEANKIPSYDAYAALRARVVGGANLTAGQQDAANAFVNSPQFLVRYPASLTLDQFVDAILNTIMTDIGVNLTSQRTALIALGSRAAVVYRLANDDLQGGNGGINNRAFIDAEYNRAFVVTQYFGYLRRDGDIGGILFWKGQVDSAPLRNVPKQNAMVCSFITSGEYQLRFGPKVPRTNNECPQ